MHNFEVYDMSEGEDVLYIMKRLSLDERVVKTVISDRISLSYGSLQAN